MWRFCFYNRHRDLDDAEEFSAKFIIYRRQSPTSSSYISVPRSVREKRGRFLQYLLSSSFSCLEDILSPEEQFEVRENDIIGACLEQMNSIIPLYLVGKSGTDSLLYQLDDNRNCRTALISKVNTNIARFRLQQDYTLHLYADIGMLFNIRH